MCFSRLLTGRLAVGAAKACSILPYTDNAELDAALALAREEVELPKGGAWWE